METLQPAHGVCLTQWDGDSLSLNAEEQRGAYDDHDEIDAE